jgi:DNA-binding GntR family transcriptional regulator
MTKLAAVAADKNLSSLLEISPTSPLLRLEARLYSKDNQVVDIPSAILFPVISTFMLSDGLVSDKSPI